MLQMAEVLLTPSVRKPGEHTSKKALSVLNLVACVALGSWASCPGAQDTLAREGLYLQLRTLPSNRLVASIYGDVTEIYISRAH